MARLRDWLDDVFDVVDRVGDTCILRDRLVGEVYLTVGIDRHIL